MARLIDLDAQKECASWGIQGESGATTLIVDLTSFLAIDTNGKAAVVFQRQDGHPYIHKFIQEGKNLFITLTQTDTQLVGKCELQVNWLGAGNRIVKSKLYRSFITPNALEGDLPLTEESIAALDNLEQYVEEAKDLLENAQQYAQELVFVATLPEKGDPNKLYVEQTEGKLYWWNGEKFVPMGGNSGPSILDYDAIIGGDADDIWDSCIIGGSANKVK